MGPFEYGLGVQEIVAALATVDASILSLLALIGPIDALLTTLLAVNTAGFASVTTALGLLIENSNLTNATLRTISFNQPIPFRVGDRIRVSVERTVGGLTRGVHVYTRAADVPLTDNPTTSGFLVFGHGYNLGTGLVNVSFGPPTNLASQVISPPMPVSPSRCRATVVGQTTYVTIERI